jgi:superkiller protein 3
MMLNKKAGWRILVLLTILSLPAVSVVRADFEQAMNYFKSGKYVEAAAEFQTLVDNSPNYDSGYYMLGLSLVKMGKPAEAEQSFAKAIEINGENFGYHHGLAKAYFDQDQYSKSVATLKTAEPLAADAQSKFALYTLRGYAYAALEEWADAVEDLENAKKIKKDGAVLSQLGKAYYGLGHNDKAVVAFREALQVRANDPTATQLLAESLINLGAKATSDAQKANYYKEAVQHAEKYQKMKPNSYEANNLVGRAALGAKDFAKAEQAFRKVLAQKPDYCYAMVNLGKVYTAQKLWADAESILTDATKCAPRMPVVYESLGFVIEKQKRLEEAIAQYEKAMEIKPSAGLRSAIDRCRENIAIRDENLAIDMAEQKQKEEEQEAQRAYEEAQRKQKEWEEAQRKRED